MSRPSWLVGVGVRWWRGVSPSWTRACRVLPGWWGLGCGGGGGSAPAGLAHVASFLAGGGWGAVVAGGQPQLDSRMSRPSWLVGVGVRWWRGVSPSWTRACRVLPGWWGLGCGGGGGSAPAGLAHVASFLAGGGWGAVVAGGQPQLDSRMSRPSWLVGVGVRWWRGVSPSWTRACRVLPGWWGLGCGGGGGSAPAGLAHVASFLAGGGWGAVVAGGQPQLDSRMSRPSWLVGVGVRWWRWWTQPQLDSRMAFSFR